MLKSSAEVWDYECKGKPVKYSLCDFSLVMFSCLHANNGKTHGWVYSGLESYKVNTIQREKDMGVECPNKGMTLTIKKRLMLDKEANKDRRDCHQKTTSYLFSSSLTAFCFSTWKEAHQSWPLI